MRRYLLALLAAYAATATLLGSVWAVRAWFYRRCFDALMRGKHGRPVHFPGPSAVARDFGMDLSPWEGLALRLADLHGGSLAFAAALIFLACLGVAASVRAATPGPPGTSPEVHPNVLRWARRGTLAAWLAGAASFGLTWGYVRWRLLHPHYLPTLSLFLALALAEVIALASCLRRLVRGPHRAAALILVVAAFIPVALWASAGAYAWAQWRQRRVPDDLPMNLAKMAACSLMRLVAASEYPNRLETERLVMFYDRLADPRRDAGAMERHLARMEAMLGGPLRAKVHWVRGGLRILGLENLSIHGVALGSGESPDDWGRGGMLDRHELAHAALDEYREYDSDPPFLLHEGWAESQSGVGSVVLARRALEQRAADPSVGIREIAGPDWYHRDDGPVYSLGGAFVDFLIRRGGVGRFVRLYNASREGRFGAAVRAVYGVELDALEDEFWEDARVRAVADGVTAVGPSSWVVSCTSSRANLGDPRGG